MASTTEAERAAASIADMGAGLGGGALATRNGAAAHPPRKLGGGGMRGIIDGLPTPFPFVLSLPAIYQEVEFTHRFMQPFDDAIAVIIATLDCFDTYLDPALTPEDFLPWIAGWVGATLDETWPIDRRRALVAEAVTLYTMRGTVAGMSRHIQLYTGGRVEIDDGGGCRASEFPEGELPGRPSTNFVVRVFVEDPSSINSRKIDALIAAGKPAHLTHQLEVIEASSTPPEPIASMPDVAVPAAPVSTDGSDSADRTDAFDSPDSGRDDSASTDDNGAASEES